MKLFTRLSATVLAGVDKTVSHIENHDAVIEASLKETQRAAARARVRLQRVTRDGESLQRREEALSLKIDHWTARAKEHHETDRSLALECIGKRKQCLDEQQELQSAIVQHNELQDQLSNIIAGIEKRAVQMSQQRNQMRSRESAAEAQRVISRIDTIETGGVDDIFERWDLSISETEISAGIPVVLSNTDTLDQRFNSVEAERELESELDALIAGDFNETSGGEQ